MNMNNIRFCSLMLMLGFQLMDGALFAQNPVVQTNYTADPAPMVHNDTVYLYTGHDEDQIVNNFFTMNNWLCYSSTDMVNWTDRGVVMSYNVFEWSRGDAWAGQCIYRNGKFYYYVPVNQKGGGNAIGVAVSDSPTGPFKDAIGKPLMAAFGYIDPAVFIDDDGQAYLYWGNPNLWYVKLNNDMVSYDKEVGIVQVPLTKEGFHIRLKDADKRPSAYEEAPWVYKRNNLYYLFYAAGGVPEHLAYSTSNSATGSWQYRDTLMHIIRKGGAFTNHPGIIDFKGKTYLFYHNGALPGGGGFNRSVCIDPIEFNADGSIPVVVPTAEGIKESVAALNPFKRVEAETIAWSEGLKTATDSQTGVYVTKINNGDYLKVRGVDFGKGARVFEASVRANAAGGQIEIRLDGKNGELMGTCLVKPSGAETKWTVVQCKMNHVKGIHDLCFVFKGGDGDLMNFDWWRFR
jgi:hypothetical protein